MIILLVVYITVSFCIGVYDAMRLYVQGIDLDHTPAGDIGYNVFPKHITGVHNIFFLPSIPVVLLIIGISKLLPVN